MRSSKWSNFSLEPPFYIVFGLRECAQAIDPNGSSMGSHVLLLAYISICVDAFTTSQARVSLSRTVGLKWKSTHTIRSSSSSSSSSDDDSYVKGAQERAAERKKTKQVHGGGIRPMWGKNLHGSAYAFLNAQELLTFTEQTLQNSPVGQMTPQEMHDAARLLPSWSKRLDESNDGAL
jgi:hypothetical protein